VLVDCGYPYFLWLVRRRLRQHRIDPASLGLILLSHGHIDHVGGAIAVRHFTGAPIAIHRADATCLPTGRFPPLVPRTWLGWLTCLPANLQRLPPSSRGEPDILLDDEYDLAPYGIDGRVVHLPGHTPGSVAVLLESGEAVIADALMVNFPFLSDPSYPIYADDMEQVRDSLRRLLEYRPRIIYTGHGGPVTPADVRRRYRL